MELTMEQVKRELFKTIVEKANEACELAKIPEGMDEGMAETRRAVAKTRCREVGTLAELIGKFGWVEDWANYKGE